MRFMTSLKFIDVVAREGSIRKAADKYNLKIALLANEGCHGGCSMMKEHFEYNNNRKDNPQYFNDYFNL